VNFYKRAYRTEAPPLPEPPDPPPLSWWTRFGEHVIGSAIFIVAVVMVIKLATCMNETERQWKAQQRAKRVEEFRKATKGCSVAERTHGDNAEVVYLCGDRRERFPASWENESSKETP
jgi:hypothetical protein